MRRQDEILCLYPGQSLLARNFLLSEMEALSLAFDSDELLEFLQGEVGDPEPAIHDQALYTLIRFLPGFLYKRYVLADLKGGVWSTCRKEPADERRAQVATSPDSSLEIGQAALLATRPLADALISRLPRESGWNRIRAIMTLAQFGLKRTSSWLLQAVEGSRPDLAVAVALAAQRGDEAEETIAAAVRRHGPADPSLHLALGSLATPVTFGALMDALGRTDTLGRMNLARALASFRGSPVEEAFDRLVARGEGWVTVCSLGSLEALKRGDLLGRIVGVHRSAHHDFLRVQAVKAAGGIPTEAALGFCFDALGTGSAAVKATALESLVRLRADPSQLRAVAMPHVGSPRLRLSVNAMLAAFSPQEALRSAALRDMLFSGDTLARLEAAYCLGYMKDPVSLEFLGTLALEDPSAAVRVQAAKSLSRFGAREAMAHLLPLLASKDAKLALTAARLMMRHDEQEAAVVAQVVKEELPTRKRPFERALLLLVLGVAARKSGREDAVRSLVEAPEDKDPQMIASLVEGLNVLAVSGQSAAGERLSRMAAPESPRTRARWLLARRGTGMRQPCWRAWSSRRTPRRPRRRSRALWRWAFC